MSKLLALLQLLAAGRATVFSLWPKLLLRRFAVGIALLLTCSILIGVLAATGIYWGYETALARGISSDQALTVIVASLGVLILASIIGLAYCVKDIKNQLLAFNLSRQMPLTTQVSNTIQGAAKGFIDGFMRGSSANMNTAYKSNPTQSTYYK